MDLSERIGGPEEVGVRRRAEWALLLAIATVVALAHLATNGRYGFHRDELQFLSDARHLDWGFVAYPPLTPFLERIGLELFGLSRQYVQRNLTSCRLAGHNGNSAGVKNEESQDHPDIFICGSPLKPWPEFWKDFQNFG